MRNLMLLTIAMLLSPLPAAADQDQLRIGVGAFSFADHGVDLQADYRLSDSHWIFGFRFIRWTEVEEDPIFGTDPSAETSRIRSGPFVCYEFTPESRWTFYVGAAVFRLKVTLDSLVTPETESASKVRPYAGFGVTGTLLPHVFVNLGLFLGFGGQIALETSRDALDESGDIDVQAQIGIAF